MHGGKCSIHESCFLFQKAGIRVGNGILKNSLWMLGGNGLQQFLQFAIFIFLARFLGPKDFGAVAFAFVFLDISTIAVRWGVADLLIQRKRVTDRLISHCFLFCIALGFVTAALIATGTFVYAHLNEVDLLVHLLLMLIPIVFLHAAEAVPEALVRRNMDFKRLALRNNFAAICGGAVALYLAYTGWGAYTLVIQRLIYVSILLYAVWVASSNRVRLFSPARYSKKIFGYVASAGGRLVSGPFSLMLGPKLSDLLVGVYLGEAALGFLKFAKRIFDFSAQITIMPVSSVSTPAFSRISQDRDSLKSVYKQMQVITAFLAFPLFIGTAAIAPYWVPLLLGPKWLDAVVLIQWTSLLVFPAVVNYFQMPLLLALSQNELILKLNALRLVLSLIGAYFGAQVSTLAVVQISVVIAFGFMAYYWIIIRRLVGWGISESFVNLAPPSFTVAFMTLTLLFVRILMPDDVAPVVIMVSEIASGGLAYCLVVYLLYRETVLTYARSVLKLRSKAG